MNPIPMPRRRLWLALAAALSLPLSGCLDDPGHEHDEQGEHVDLDTVDESDHGDEPHMLSVTTWSGALELFMEYPEPVAGEPGKYITHLTWLEDFSPVVSGPLRYRFSREDGHVEEHVAETVARDGIFLPEIAVERPGHYHLELVLGRGDDRWTIEAGHVDVVAANQANDQRGDEPVHDEEHHGADDHGHDEAGDIAFLKEQQWRMDFAVQPVFNDYITERLSLPARIEPRPGQSAEVTAPAGGRLLPPENDAWQRPGERVEAGEVLARVLPLSGAEDVGLLDLDLTQARERLSLARAERDRVQRLYGDGVVSEKRLEQATSEYRVARQALERARTRLEQLEGGRDQSEAAVALRAPIGGVITASPHAPGELVARDQAVFSVLDDSRVWLKAMAYPGDMARIKGPGDLVARQAGGQWQSLPGAEHAYTGTRTEEN
ncbi:efflux RND transporter periplasmic adaptor subunit, partial [Guyparkeria sp.]|uniref:efflux RND transporter periplasmic adaptor subunit n=1 Tax=Guyparkeria sp. TaxID=2035736 RepID=UPI003970FCE2